MYLSPFLFLLVLFCIKMSEKFKYKVVIVGGGSAGWMTAAALSKFLPRDHKVTLIESSAIGTVSVGEATIPGIVEFNQMLGINEAEFLKATKGSFKLGIEFADWGWIGNRYMHPFGPYGINMNAVSFHHYWLKDRLSEMHEKNKQNSIRPLSSYNLEYSAAMQGKFCHPQPQSRSPLASIKYAYHFDASLYADFLSAYAVANGVEKIDGRILDIHQSLDGDISHLTLADSRRVEGDLFIDCSGFKGLLIHQTLGVPFDDWREYLPCDSAIAQASQAKDEVLPYTISHAHSSGWSWHIPLQHRTGNGCVYASDFMQKKDAEDILAQRIAASSKPINDPRELKWINGKRVKAWERNCVAIGLSQGFIEPLESTGIQLIQSAIQKLLALFPNGKSAQSQINAFNRYTDEEMLTIRDFVVLHYKLNKRTDSDFWQYCQHMPIPDTLQAKMDLYRETGRIFRDNNELFNDISWLSVMHGQGLAATSYHPMVDAMDEEQRQLNLQKIAGAMNESVAQMPSHTSYLNQYLANAK